MEEQGKEEKKQKLIENSNKKGIKKENVLFTGDNNNINSSEAVE